MSMQLNLFEDNKAGILLNIANELILSRDLDQAIDIYEQLVTDSPDDAYISSILKNVNEWHTLLSEINETPDLPEYLNTLWLRLKSISFPALKTTVLATLIDTLRGLPEPEQIYIRPDFHLSQLLITAQRYTEAADSLSVAVAGDIVDRGKFLAWRGDALTLAGNKNDAVKSYFEAFLTDPATVDINSIKHRVISNLLLSLHFDAADEIDEEEEAAWLPVWGWFYGIFPLPFQKDKLPDAAKFDDLIAKDDSSIPRLWFEMLAYAERCRIMGLDAVEQSAVRRLMKKCNSFMFGLYLEKIGGRKF